MIRVFVGFDPREAACYHVCCQTIIENTREQVAFHPVSGERRDGSNDFIYARFLVPWRCGFSGIAIFLDGDMVVRGDIGELAACIRMDKGVHVVQHDDYKTKHPIKYLGYKNEDYPRKNWSSVMGFNCGFYPNRRLTPQFVSQQSGSYLHRFGWLLDGQIGALPPQWNRLVLEQEVQPDDKLLHYTCGAPCFEEYADCDHAEEWHAAYRRATLPCRGI